MNAKAQKTVVTHSPEETRRLAAELLRELRPGAVLALHGDLGAGKTCFVQGLAAALGVHQPVSSPTFTLIHEYDSTPPLFHADLYRIRDADDAYGLGLDEYLGGTGITVIEWAERAMELLPPDAWHLTFEVGPDLTERTITIERPNRNLNRNS
jgi:tRNA threonylcarbamoyladenosine biosynthesis protein TsaE